MLVSTAPRHYTYDGSFEGLLTVLQTSLNQHPESDITICSESAASPQLFGQTLPITTDSGTAQAVVRNLQMSIGPWVVRHVLKAYLSEIEGIETSLHRYLQLGKTVGSRLQETQFETVSFPVTRAVQKLHREEHRLLGLLRFVRLQSEVFYAPCEPDHNVLLLLAPHFCRRFGAQPWIIHDRKRQCCVWGSKNRWSWLLWDPETTLVLHEEEAAVQELWQQFFNRVSIPWRRSSRRQRNFMPKRYWKYLVEKSDSDPFKP